MHPSHTATVVIVPGVRDHVAGHWQTILEQKLSASRPVVTVPHLPAEKLHCAARVEAIERTVAAIKGTVILVAHSGGVILVAHWARKYPRTIQGALLAVPPDFDHPLPAGYPTMEELRSNGWLPVPRTALPFPSLVAASTNDPLARLDRVEAMARDWGSTLVNMGAVGHLNPASGFGEWCQADDLIQQLER